MARGTYRMTPRRRAALRRAQLISARKRRKAKFITAAKTVGSIAGAIAVTAATHQINKALTNPREFGKDVAYVKGLVRRKAVVPSPKLAAPTARNMRPIRGYYGGKAMHRSVAGRRIRSK